LPAKAVKTIANVGKTQVALRACFALFLKRVKFILTKSAAAQEQTYPNEQFVRPKNYWRLT
jgi:hypothetical protein